MITISYSVVEVCTSIDSEIQNSLLNTFYCSHLQIIITVSTTIVRLLISLQIQKCYYYFAKYFITRLFATDVEVTLCVVIEFWQHIYTDEYLLTKTTYLRAML